MYTAARRLTLGVQLGYKHAFLRSNTPTARSSTLATGETDPLYYGTANETSANIPKFRSGKKIYHELESLMDEGKPLEAVLTAPSQTLKFFNKHFPQVVESNSVGQISGQDFNHWKPNKNNIVIEVDTNPQNNSAEAKDIYIGGPAALFAAAVQAHDAKDAGYVLYAHDGVRGASNWKGSASYYHIRDCIPVYFWPDNSGVYTVYCTLKHHMQKKLFNSSYKNEIYNHPNFNKLRLNIWNLLNEPLLSWLMIKNTWHTLKDVNLHLTKTHLRKAKKSTAYVTMEHARLSRDIVPRMQLDKPVLMINSDRGKALHLHLGKEAEVSRNVFRNLSRIIGEPVRNIPYTERELAERGYDAKFVKQGFEFPNDGYVPPYTDQVLEKKILDCGGTVNASMRLKKILVVPTNGSDYKASKIVWENMEDGTTHSTPVKTLHLSLGPSAKVVSVNFGCKLSTHFVDAVKSFFVRTPGSATNSSAPTFSSLLSRLAEKVTGRNMIERIMWASGLSSVILVKVDKSLVSESNMIKFRDHVDAHNKNAVRLAEKELVIDGRPHQLFALQFTGGGHFPARNVHAEAALNVLKANFVPLFGLEAKGIEYEIIQARSCARGVTAQNCFRIKVPLANMVQLYAVGGIGMTTMGPNALLMKAILRARQKLSAGEISNEQFEEQLRQSSFTDIPHWPHGNPFTRNYAQFVDSVSDPREVARKLGIPASSESPILEQGQNPKFGEAHVSVSAGRQAF